MSKILVAYSTWAGATREVGEKIAQIFEERGYKVTVDNARSIKTLANYSAVILGASIQMGRPTGDFKKFLKRFHNELAHKDTAFFILSLNMIEDIESSRTETMSWLEKATSQFQDVDPISIGLFAGAVVTDSPEYKALIFLVKKMITLMKSNMETQKGKSDFRDWEKIREWALALTEKIPLSS